jgi:hypothetical protein
MYFERWLSRATFFSCSGVTELFRNNYPYFEGFRWKSNLDDSG